MLQDPPFLYFRTRENGALVYRVEDDARLRRLDFVHVANANIRNGDIKIHGDADLSDAERAEIEAWIATRRDQVAADQSEDARRLSDEIHRTTQWLQSRAGPEDVRALAEPLLLAMQDMRMVLVRKLSELPAPEADDGQTDSTD
ncbi:hypothetical protein [Oceanomicrobium pacificus]|uniref:Uncharacterized protein n=1 Tax=Oceanomicrobium pacificus TaxID=2692916 RepID=A0A6B0TV98_9RHOB|nr:hypothetical protein [Oceanomicrobium pacificus]MXU65695.1 hypothetical protein [Oceanomicrobium pacificus]